MVWTPNMELEMPRISEASNYHSLKSTPAHMQQYEPTTAAYRLFNGSTNVHRPEIRYADSALDSSISLTKSYLTSSESSETSSIISPYETIPPYFPNSSLTPVTQSGNLSGYYNPSLSVGGPHLDYNQWAYGQSTPTLPSYIYGYGGLNSGYTYAGIGQSSVNGIQN